tara:strand:+ start:73 stop:375 length:303 start_codon:yes stop_codon:yes gene_type:complete
MDRRVVLEKYTVERDDWNVPVKTWRTSATVWASKHDRSSSEVLENKQTVNLNRTTFRIRYRSNADTTMRVLYDNDYYYVVGVKELGRKEGVELTTEKRDE